MDEAAGSEYSFEKSYTREIAPGEPAVIQVRENESLVVATRASETRRQRAPDPHERAGDLFRA